jgi:riboflavin kinase/FMN adenylyltransferase
MKIIRDFNDIDYKFEKPVLTIGKFDGVHLGHLGLIGKVLERASALKGTAAALTFEPHPKKILLPHERIELITTPGQKRELLEKAGLEILFVQKFSSGFSIRGPEEFVKDVLVGKIGIHTLVLGTDFSFGRGAIGDHKLMKKYGEDLGFEVALVPPIVHGKRQVSSTHIRDLIKTGKMKNAANFLGRFYFLDGKVIRGEGRGREMHVPTANILTENELIPPQGVYATYLEMEGKRYDSVTNIGIRPTFGGSYLSIESNLMEMEMDLYGKYVRLHFVQRMRNERRFDSVGLLKIQIRKDIRRALKILCENALR